MLDVDEARAGEGGEPPPGGGRRGLFSFLFSGSGWPYLLVPFIPLAVALELGHASPTLIFFTSAIGVVPTAAVMGTATEELADRAGPGIGGLLNVTFGNLPELLIAFFALREGLHEVVKASIIGSVLGNVLLVLGGSMLVGGLRRDRQEFNQKAASSQADDADPGPGGADDARGLRARQGRRPAAAGRRARLVRQRRRGAVADRGDRAAARLRRRAVVLAHEPPRPVQPARRRRRRRRARMVDQEAP